MHTYTYTCIYVYISSYIHGGAVYTCIYREREHRVLRYNTDALHVSKYIHTYNAAPD